MKDINVKQLVDEQTNVKELGSIECGNNVKKALSEIPDSDRLRFLVQVKAFCITASTYLIDKQNP